jgi:hypothetical protein
LVELAPVFVLGALTPDPEVRDGIPKVEPPVLVTPFVVVIVPVGGVMPPVGVTVPGMAAALGSADVVACETVGG